MTLKWGHLLSLEQPFELIKSPWGKHMTLLADVQMNLQSLSQRTGIWISSTVFLGRCLNQRRDLLDIRPRFHVIGFIRLCTVSLILTELFKGWCTNGMSIIDWAGIHVVSAAQKNDSPCRNTTPRFDANWSLYWQVSWL